MTRVLLIRPGALGDLLLVVPAVQALRSQIPEAHVTLAGHAEAVDLVRGASVVDAGVSQDDRRLLSLFSTEGGSSCASDTLGDFDIAVAWLRDPEGIVAANLRRLVAGKVVIAPSVPEGSTTHVADHLVHTLSPLGISPPPPTEFRLRPPTDAAAWTQERLSALNTAGAPVVAVHPGSGSPKKNWLAGGFAEVVETLVERGLFVVLLCGPADESAIESVQNRLRAPVPVLRSLPLARLAAVLARCAAYLGNDSGVTHLSALMGAPTVALFGPTDPDIWAPRGARTTNLRWWGKKDLTPQLVVEAVESSLAL